MRSKLKTIAKLFFMLILLGSVWTYLHRGLADSSNTELPQVIPPEPDLEQLVRDVDREFELTWAEQQLQPAPLADWRTVCRRLSLALVGNGLSLEEIRSLEQIPEPERIDAFVERLLQQERFTSYWAERYARTFVGNEDGPFLVYRRRRFVTWLGEQIKENRPYDQIVRELIEATGFATDKPAANFLTFTLQGGMEDGQPDPIRLAARTTRAVLGTRIDCLQCHDDFLDSIRLGDPSSPRSGTQQDFHALAAFYATARMSPLQGIRNDEDHVYKYKYLHDEEETEVAPNVPFARELLPEQGNTRQRLATWATHPENMPAMRAAVGRVWAFMFGKPITNSVDDIPLTGALPPGLDRLAKDFAQHNYDLHRLVRSISRLRVFRVDSRSPDGVTADHENAWAAFPLVPLRPEQVAGSIVQACQLSTIDRDSAFLLQLTAFGETNDFVKRYGDTGEDEFKQDSVTITQRLQLMNGKLVRERTDNNPILNASTQIAMFAPEDNDAVDAAYLSVLNRLPTAGEREVFVARVAETKNKKKAIEDIYWALLNTTEFSWNH